MIKKNVQENLTTDNLFFLEWLIGSRKDGNFGEDRAF